MSDRITDEKEVADLREQLAAAQSSEVCTVAHSDEVMEFCPYCKIERLRGDLSETRIALANAECREGVAKARLAEALFLLNRWHEAYHADGGMEMLDDDTTTCLAGITVSADEVQK